MDAIRSFLTKYHAVPDTGDGPDWSRASDDALIGWATEDAQAYRDDPASRPHLTYRMVAVCRELDRRREATTDPDRAARFGGASAKLSGAIGGLRLGRLIAESKQ